MVAQRRFQVCRSLPHRLWKQPSRVCSLSGVGTSSPSLGTEVSEETGDSGRDRVGEGRRGKL